MTAHTIRAAPAAPAALLEVEDLHVRLPVGSGTLHAVRGVDLTVARGRTLCLVGESGSGKSMTALALLGLSPRGAEVTAHRIALEGRPHDPKTLRGHRVAMIFQEPMTALNPVFTIGDQLSAVHRRHRGGTDEAARARARALLDRVGVPEPKRRLVQYPHELSGGLRQRVLIAMALLCGPELLVADEPTTALDVTTQAQILALLQELQAEMGLGLLLITHDLGVVARVAHEVAVMYAGRIVERGAARDVLRRPIHPYTAGLLASVPHMERGDAGPGGQRGDAGPGGQRGDAGPGGRRRLGTIPGIVPSLTAPIPGCAYAARCSRALPRCRDVFPPVVSRDGRSGHTALCHNPLTEGRDLGQLSDDVGAYQGEEPPADRPILEVRAVGRTYGSDGWLTRKPTLRALRGVDMTVRPGEVVGLVGESGCGKSTLARILIGLDAADEGTVAIDGRPIDAYARRDLARIVQPVFQDPYGSLNPTWRVRDILDLPLRVHGLGNADARKARVAELAAGVGLPDRALDASPRALSGGQRQRVAIARALAVSPRLLVCDEPTSALDVSVQAQILNLLQDLRARTGIAIVLISHDLAVVEHMCDRVMVMYAGRIVEEGGTGDVLTRPRHPYTAALREAVFAVDDPYGLPDLPLGASPPPLGNVEGCALAPRCPKVGDRCRVERPPLDADGADADHRFACHHPMRADARADLAQAG